MTLRGLHLGLIKVRKNTCSAHPRARRLIRWPAFWWSSPGWPRGARNKGRSAKYMKRIPAAEHRPPPGPQVLDQQREQGYSLQHMQEDVDEAERQLAG